MGVRDGEAAHRAIPHAVAATAPGWVALRAHPSIGSSAPHGGRRVSENLSFAATPMHEARYSGAHWHGQGDPFNVREPCWRLRRNGDACDISLNMRRELHGERCGRTVVRARGARAAAAASRLWQISCWDLGIRACARERTEAP